MSSDPGTPTTPDTQPPTVSGSIPLPSFPGRQRAYYVADPSVSGAWLWFSVACAVAIASTLIYECVRRRPGFKRVLYTRTETNRRESPPIPYELFGWVKPVWQLPESYIAENIGLDAVMFLRFLKMCFTIIAILVCLLIPILLPINYYSNRHGPLPPPGHDDGIDVGAENSTSRVKFGKANLDNYSFANVPEESSFLWAHVVCAYVASLVTYYFLFTSYRDYAHLATSYIHGTVRSPTKRTPAWRKGELVQLRTVLVQNMPEDLQSDAKLKAYFEALGIGTVERATMDRDPGNKVSRMTKQRRVTLGLLERAYVHWLINIDRERDKRKGKRMRRRYTPGELLRLQASPLNLQDMGIDELGLARLRPKRRQRRRHRANAKKSASATWSLSLGKDEIDHYTQKLTDLTVKLKHLRKVGCGDVPEPAYQHEAKVNSAIASNAAGFVTFKTQQSAQMAAQILIHASEKIIPMSVTLAPAVQDVIWDNISMPGWRRVIQGWTITIMVFFFSFFWIIPTSLIASFTSLDSLAKVPAFEGLVMNIAKTPRLYFLIKTVGPPIVINSLNLLVPYIFEYMSMQQGLPSNSSVELATMSKYFFFLFFNIFFVFTIAQTIIKVTGQFLENPISIVNLAVEFLPSAATFFLNYIILNLMLFPVELLRPGIMIIQLVGRWLCETPREFNELAIFSSYLNYGFLYPIHVLIFVICICYSTIAPLILLPGALYFAVGWFVYRNQLLFVYVKEWESYGYHWVMAFHRCTVGLGVAQVLLAGLLALKKSPTASAFCVPLVVLTIIFHKYCQTVFKNRTHLIPLDRFSGAAEPAPRVSRGGDGEDAHAESSVECLSADPNASRDDEGNNNTSTESIVVDESLDSLESEAKGPPSAAGPDNTTTTPPPMDIVTSAEQHAADRYPTSYLNPIFSKPMPRPWLPVSMAAWWGLPSRVDNKNNNNHPPRDNGTDVISAAAATTTTGSAAVVRRSKSLAEQEPHTAIQMENLAGPEATTEPTAWNVTTHHHQQPNKFVIDNEHDDNDDNDNDDDDDADVISLADLPAEDLPVTNLNGTFQNLTPQQDADDDDVEAGAFSFSRSVLSMVPAGSTDSMTALVDK
ncbi:hypothetical protein PhCBS80983_g01641 [Powellomyces hirtus]|uniref:CSC1/OSCA1-like 7TM region domain-containing protein n=1 Tax=Powellomyces hirtus TaxID=109895 RepID=A0A507EBP2_9FUNG|nr:hypothetical protein PhCBS80983_g01641 [Powellomyces hirtus]